MYITQLADTSMIFTISLGIFLGNLADKQVKKADINLKTKADVNLFVVTPIYWR
ncbi:MAG: hypothetical protein RMY28_019765 [Nostoc sp. ChiSLP01]|nr:hypothetical protein [Nostoc sp. CmiSLP01]MDZ8287052.1 hypothetical protein [Nostoc sp. ChiSLP01]